MILISILSNDITTISPIIFEFKDKIVEHVTVYNDVSLELVHLEDLTKGIDALKKKYALSFKSSTLVLDEDSKSSIEQSIQKILDLQNGENKLYLNSSSSMVNVSILFSAQLLKTGGKVIVYDKHDNSYNVLAKNAMKTRNIKNNMGLDDFLMMLDKPIIEAANEKHLKKRKEEVFKLFNDFEAFQKVRIALLKDDKKFEYGKYPNISTYPKLNSK